MALNLPIQGVVNRRVPVPPYRERRTLTRLDTGEIEGYQDVPVAFGPVPGDPPPWRRIPDGFAGYPAAALVAALLGRL